MGSFFYVVHHLSCSCCACFDQIYRLEVAEVGEDSYRYLGYIMGDLREKIILLLRMVPSYYYLGDKTEFLGCPSEKS